VISRTGYSGTPIPRAVAVVIREARVLLIRRRRGGAAYAVLPGGHVEPSESAEEPVSRELAEETTLAARIERRLWTRTDGGRPASYFLMRDVVGTAVLGGEEAVRNSEENSYQLVWAAASEFDAVNLQPAEIRVLLTDLLMSPRGLADTVRGVLADYDPRWPAEFESAATAIRTATGENWVIEHIGSTSIIGMPAKPIIDLAVRVEQLAQIDEHDRDLSSIGFVAIAAGPRTHRVRVRLNGSERTHVAHFFAASQWAGCNQRIFRDWLRAHPEDRDLYANAKRAAEVAAVGARDYTARKTATVQEIVDRARRARDLPVVDVWDK
jgi:GrpB-like predicted nucleotidyltransferase (UPF0157 family)/8-oxo-dGTP pyrophosphatase MutT (NUDIX family)